MGILAAHVTSKLKSFLIYPNKSHASIFRTSSDSCVYFFENETTNFCFIRELFVVILKYSPNMLKIDLMYI